MCGMWTKVSRWVVWSGCLRWMGSACTFLDQCTPRFNVIGCCSQNLQTDVTDKSKSILYSTLTRFGLMVQLVSGFNSQPCLYSFGVQDPIKSLFLNPQENSRNSLPDPYTAFYVALPEQSPILYQSQHSNFLWNTFTKQSVYTSMV